MDSNIFNGYFTGLIIICIVGGALLVGLIWGSWELFFVDDVIRVSEPLVPEIEVMIKNDVADTTYVYRLP